MTNPSIMISWSHGADPERFLFENGKPIPAHTVFGDRKNPFQTTKGPVYRDGYAVEFNPRATHCRENLIYSMQQMRREVKRLLQPFNIELRSVATVETDPKDFIKAPPDVMRFGCDSSLCPYDMVEKSPQLEKGYMLRHSGGHFHLGASCSIPRTETLIPWNKWAEKGVECAWMLDDEDAALYMRMLDRYIGLFLNNLFHGRTHMLRRRYYGQAGEFRFQRYNDTTAGLEYRTPPPEVWNHPEIASYCLGMMRYVARHFKEFRTFWKRESSQDLEQDIRGIINSGVRPGKMLKYVNVDGIVNPTIIRKFESWLKTANERTPLYTHGWQYFLHHRVPSKAQSNKAFFK